MFSQWGKSDSYVQRGCWKTFGCMIYKTTSDKFCVGSSQIFFVLPCGLFLPQTIKYCHQRLIKIWLFEFGFPPTRQIFIKIRLRILNQLSGSGNSIWGGVGGVILTRLFSFTWYGYKLEFARGLATDGLLLVCLSFLTSSHCEIYSAWPEEGAPTLKKNKTNNTHHLMVSFLRIE